MDILERTALMRHLKKLDEPVLYGRLVSLREKIGEWLAYIPATFPHYTRHTVGHSDEIVRQISSFLFEDLDSTGPTLPLSAAEIYAIIASAYLHDAGMVASEREKGEMLASPGWTEWISSGGGSRRWNQIKEMRSEAAADDSNRHFLADLQTRFLIAEYIRRNHSIRAASFLEESNELFSAYYFPDPAMLKTVADICIGHGLDWRELENPERYPLRRDVAEGPMNVRLLAFLLRLGDLLDLSHDRACPLLLNAAAPLPYDSLANWAQYRRIVHRLTDPKRIEITAECSTQDEHRILRDWCQWIQDETEHAAVLLQGSNRHGTWRPPTARLSHPGATINIRPRSDASYIPVDWTFEIDESTVFERLIVDAYQGPLDAVRELLQNAADANRCILAQRLRARGQSYSGWVEEQEKDALESLQITVTISEIDRPNDLSGELETKTVIKVEDTGIGMDRDVVQRFLLQVGRSYYTSRDFQQDFGFVPTSRFGIGFLSVFSVSDRVEVDTYKPSTGGQPLKLRLTGPKGYVLLDRGNRQTQGTSISLELRESVSVADLVEAIRKWCTRLEFPVIVQSSEDGSLNRITAEYPLEQATYQLGMQDYRAVRYRAIPIKTSTARGELYVLETLSRQDIWRWDIDLDSLNRHLADHNPFGAIPIKKVKPLLASHGITIAEASDYELPLRIDYRKKHRKFQLGLGRISWGRGDFPPADEEVYQAVAQILVEHYESLGADWSYRQSVANALHVPEQILYDLPGMVRAFDYLGQPVYRTLREVRNTRQIALVTSANEDKKVLTGGQLEERVLNIDANTEFLYILTEDVAKYWKREPERYALRINRKFKKMYINKDFISEYMEVDQDVRERTYQLQVLLEDFGDDHDEVLLVVSPVYKFASTSISRAAVNSRNPLFSQLNQALGGQWEVGETRLLSSTSTRNNSQDEISRIVEIMLNARFSLASGMAADHQLNSALRALAKSGVVPIEDIEKLRFRWNRGMLQVAQLTK